MNNKPEPLLLPPMTGLLPLLKPAGKTSFHMVSLLRRATGIRKIGHAGTLDPFATGVMIMLIGKSYTRLADRFLTQDKRYTATLHLGISTDSFDLDGQTTATSPLIPDAQQIHAALTAFQGISLQTPPMFSAKKIQGQRLYHLARQGVTVHREPVKVTIHIELLSYTYPHLLLDVRCSKGTYIRSLAHDIGNHLGCGAHLTALMRTESGPYHLAECCDATRLNDPLYPWHTYLQTL